MMTKHNLSESANFYAVYCLFQFSCKSKTYVINKLQVKI